MLIERVVDARAIAYLRQRRPRRRPGTLQACTVIPSADLARMLSALGREQDIPKLRDIRRLIELDCALSIER